MAINSNYNTYFSNNLNGAGMDLPETDAQLFKLEQFPLFNTEDILNTILLNIPNNKELLQTILKLLADELPKNITALQTFHANGDWGNIEKLAHKMKGSALNCGSVKMRYACQYLERYRKSGRSLQLEPLYQQLLAVLNETQRSLNQLLTCG